jgi:hypothetical protein
MERAIRAGANRVVRRTANGDIIVEAPPPPQALRATDPLPEQPDEVVEIDEERR